MRKNIVVILLICLLALSSVVFAMFDYFNFFSHIGLTINNIRWLSDIIDFILGIATISLTLLIAYRQNKIEENRIISDKFFKLIFIREYQRIELCDGGPTLKLKVYEPKNTIIKNLKIVGDVAVEHISNNGRVDENFGLEIISLTNNESTGEHTDEKMDRESSNNSSDFEYFRFKINKNNFNQKIFQQNNTYRLTITFIATDIFGVQLKCKLKPWLKYIKDTSNTLEFEVIHNFGEYESVCYSK
ncbi:hypothetical protein IJI76_03280 [Candidatus Saccharibacteria bacterium]|nr:hypothetical protein [Candidatus Saccharibacteria bacterium]